MSRPLPSIYGWLANAAGAFLWCMMVACYGYQPRPRCWPRGRGQVYAQTTNPTASTGDGVAMTWRAGGQLRDLEFFQFHPTSLAQPGAPPF